MMQKYMVFPIPVGFREVEASSVEAAINKYRKNMPEMDEQEVIIAPSHNARKTSIDVIFKVCECGYDKIE